MATGLPFGKCRSLQRFAYCAGDLDAGSGCRFARMDGKPVGRQEIYSSGRCDRFAVCRCSLCVLLFSYSSMIP